MADNVSVDNGDLTDYDVVTDEITSPYTGGTKHAQGVKLLSGTANANDVIPGDATNGLDVDVTRLPSGTVAGSSSLPAGTNAIGKLAANDGVDIGDVTINNASGASAVNIQDGGNSITVDGTVAVSGTVTVDSELTTADLDSGAGTDTRAVVGLAGTASGGAQLIPGSSTDGLLVNLGANNDVTVTGTVSVTGESTAGTPTHTADITVDATAGGVTLLASNANRKSAVIQNVGAANIRVSVGGTPTTTNGIQLAPGQTLALSMPYIPTGAIKAIREGGSSSTAAVLEVA